MIFNLVKALYTKNPKSILILHYMKPIKFFIQVRMAL